MISFPYKDTTSYQSYIQGESAKFIDSSGARGVAILYDQAWTTSATALNNLNGIFIQNNFYNTSVSDAAFNETLTNAYKYVVNLNDKGVVFPLWASGESALLLCHKINLS